MASEPQLTEAQKRALHHCPCGHLIESHDFTGCFADDGSCGCEETFEGQLFTTTYDTVAALRAEHTQALQAEVERYRRIVTDAALETYTPDGSEIVVAQIHEYARRAEAAEGEVRRLRTGIEALVVEIERPYEASPRRRRGWVDRLRGLLDGGH